MNIITARVSDISTVDNLNIIEFDLNGSKLSMMSLELPESVKIGTTAKLTCKATHVAVGKDISGELSYSNRLTCKVESMDMGELLCALRLKLSNGTIIESIITKKSALRMNLKSDDVLVALIKASELSIEEITDE